MERERAEILAIDLDGAVLRARRTEWRSTDSHVDLVGTFGGSALALAIVAEDARSGCARAPFVIAVGDAVRRGLPTAARACVASRAPLTQRYADGHVGGRLGVHLASHASALVLRGTTTGPNAVLAIDARGVARIERLPGLTGLETPARLEYLRREFPRSALLACGPAGDARVPFASLANESIPPSFVGRGGMGAVLGGLGLAAVAVESAARPRVVAEVDRSDPPSPALLLQSARLRARALGGTFESRGGDTPADPMARKGCRGCPTPCGYVFERATGAIGARQSAIEALASPLGLTRFEDALTLLARCDALGIDAKEVGLALSLLIESAQASIPLFGDVTALLRVLDDVPARRGLGARIAVGSSALARELGLAAPLTRGGAARAESDLASLLGQCISTRGADPMRTFAFLAADVPDRARLARLLAPWNLPELAEDPRNPAGKGRLVAWTESFLAVVDAAGFCAFSAAALLADGIVSLDELASWIAPDAVREELGDDGRALLAAGATIVLLQRDLARAHGATADEDRPSFAVAELDRAGMLDEYRRFRGLDAAGQPTDAARLAVGTLAVLDLHGEQADVVESAPLDPPGEVRHLGRVVLRATGPLGVALGSPRCVELLLPASLVEVLDAASLSHPDSRAWLVRNGHALPIAARHGQRLGRADQIVDGDELDLVLALSGG